MPMVEARTGSTARFREMAEAARAQLAAADAATRDRRPEASALVFGASLATARLLGYLDAVTILDPGLAGQLLPEVEAIVNEVDRLGGPRPSPLSRLS